MEFGIKKCGVLVLKRGTVVSSEGVEMPDGERIKEIEKNGYRYLGILEYNKIKESKMKENFQRIKVMRRRKLIMRSRLNCRNHSNNYMGCFFDEIWCRYCDMDKKRT